jgi:hypothetical protein
MREARRDRHPRCSAPQATCPPRDHARQHKDRGLDDHDPELGALADRVSSAAWVVVFTSIVSVTCRWQRAGRRTRPDTAATTSPISNLVTSQRCVGPA